MTTPPTAPAPGALPYGRDVVHQPGDDLDAAPAPATPEAGPDGLLYPDVASWVEGMLLPHHRRPLAGDTRWCPQWWDHTEALARLEALWRAWEHMRHQGPTGLAVWFRDYCDPMMAQLTSRNGPFHACKSDSRGGHQVPQVWPSVPPPAGLLDAVHLPTA